MKPRVNTHSVHNCVPSAVAIEPIEPDVSTTSTMSEGTRAPVSGCAARSDHAGEEDDMCDVKEIRERNSRVVVGDGGLGFDTKI